MLDIVVMNDFLEQGFIFSSCCERSIRSTAGYEVNLND